MEQTRDASLQSAYDAKFRSFVLRVSVLQVLLQEEPLDYDTIDAANTEVQKAHVAYNQARDAFAHSLDIRV